SGMSGRSFAPPGAAAPPLFPPGAGMPAGGEAWPGVDEAPPSAWAWVGGGGTTAGAPVAGGETTVPGGNWPAGIPTGMPTGPPTIGSTTMPPSVGKLAWYGKPQFGPVHGAGKSSHVSQWAHPTATAASEAARTSRLGRDMS